MKKTVNVNIGGSPFIMDEDAYNAMKRYLHEIEVRLDGSENQEVLEDIETRIADLFTENLASRNQVVNMQTVKRAITIIGNASEFGEPLRSLEVEEEQQQQPAPRRLFRSRKERILGGVCGGLAEYFDIDLTLTRVIMFILIFFGGLSLWVYIVLWIVLPQQPLQSKYFKNNRSR